MMYVNFNEAVNLHIALMYCVYKHQVADICQPAGYRLAVAAAMQQQPNVKRTSHDCCWQMGVAVTVNNHLSLCITK